MFLYWTYVQHKKLVLTDEMKMLNSTVIIRAYNCVQKPLCIDKNIKSSYSCYSSKVVLAKLRFFPRLRCCAAATNVSNIVV